MDPQTPCLPQSSIPATFLIPRRAKPYLGPQRASYGGPDPTSPALVGGLMLKLKLQYFGHLIRRTDSLEKTLMLGRLKAGGEGATEDEMV